MELSGCVLILTLSLISYVNCQEYKLTVSKEEDTLAIGAKPNYNCFINERADFLINNPLKWEKHTRGGVKKVISTLANVESGLETEYNVQLQTTDSGMSFTLSFLQGMKNDSDGFFKCILYSKDNNILAEKQVEIHILKMFSAMKFKLASQTQTEVGAPALAIRLEEGTYKAKCSSMGSNPAASIKILLDNVDQGGAETVIEDKAGTDPRQEWNVERKVTLDFKPDDDNKILKCVSKVNNDDTMMGELSYQLDIFTVQPELECNNVSAVTADKFVKLECTIKLPGIDCEHEIFWENGESGEQYMMDTTTGSYRTVCEPLPNGSVKTSFIIDLITEKDFKSDFFVVYVNKHGTSKRLVVPLNQDYNNAPPTKQYAIFVLCSTILAAMFL